MASAIIFIACYLNYYGGVHFWLRGDSFLYSFCWYSVLFFLFFAAGILIETGTVLPKNKTLALLLLTAPILFALKVSLPFYQLMPQGITSLYKQAFQQPASWMGGVVLIIFCLLMFHRFTEGSYRLYGVKKTGSLFPYLLLIAAMVPLLTWASLQHDFSLVYPRAKVITQVMGNDAKPGHFLIFEAAYVSDFITIELFFRGFLIAVLSKVLGRNAVLPAALFYFCIHLGKPMFEAISSFFGGMILGTISYQSKSIWGGWLVHAGIALLMELFGYLF